jgi:hypothetical protein
LVFLVALVLAIRWLTPHLERSIEGPTLTAMGSTAAVRATRRRN